MRRLLLIRHAKSSWKFNHLDDHERPLNKRGQRDTISMARYLADQDEALDVMFSSTATRALELAQAMSEFASISLVPDLSFYTFDVDEMLEILQSLPPAAQRVAVVAHNPAITRAANHLAGADIVNVPTAGIVALNCPITAWEELSDVGGACEIDYFVSPKTIPHD